MRILLVLVALLVAIASTSAITLEHQFRRARILSKWNAIPKPAREITDLNYCMTKFLYKIPMCSAEKCFYIKTAGLEVKGDDDRCRKLDGRDHTIDPQKAHCADNEAWNGATAVFDLFYKELPAFVVLPKTEQHVKDILACAFEKKISVAVKSGGHSYAGGSTIDNAGFIIYMHLMDSISFVKAAAGVPAHLEIGAGARWEKIYQTAWDGNKNDETGYVVTGGTCPTVSTGYILGGGIGPNSRMYGMGNDNVLSLQMVTHDGASVLTVDAFNNQNLFWALRGAGQGNFGVVTSYKLKAYKSAIKDFTSSQMNSAATTKTKFKYFLGKLATYEAGLPKELTMSIFFSLPAAGDKFKTDIKYDYLGKDSDADAAVRAILTDANTDAIAFTKTTIGTLQSTHTTYPEFALHHANHLSYFESGGAIIYENVMLKDFTAVADTIITVMEKDFDDGVRVAYAVVHFPSSTQVVAADATPFAWRSEPFMLVRCTIPTKGTVDTQAGFDLAAKKSSVYWATEMRKAAGVKLGSYIGFPIAFPEVKADVHHYYFGANWDRLKTIYSTTVTTFNPLAYRSTFNIGTIHPI